MDVQLYVYDLSRGLARQMSLAFLGVQIDAVYHTSLVFGEVEYFFGAGVQTCYPGTTHHGQPMQKIGLGKTELPLDVILEYLESLKQTYTAESYDLFLHNCNNFSNDFAMFLVGKGIPAHITSLPQRVLDTPFGQMLRPQLDQVMRRTTQAPVPASNIPSRPQAQVANGRQQNNHLQRSQSKVRNVTSLNELEALLKSAGESCAVIFFTSSTCAPCKICYGPYDELADEFEGKSVLIKIDLNIAADVSFKYKVPGTPTFITFLKGEKFEQWSGADPAKLTGNVRTLVQMAHPPHPHRTMQLPSFQQEYKPGLYTAVPPLEKLLTKLGDLGQSTEVQALKTFVQKRYKESAADAPVPDLKSICSFVKEHIEAGQNDSSFALIDLLRIAAADARISGYLVEESTAAVWSVIDAVCTWEAKALPSTRLVTVQLACNLFSSLLLTRHLEKGAQTLTRLATWLILDESSSAKVRECAATLVQNIAVSIQSCRLSEKPDSLSESYQVELSVCLLESVQRNQEPDVLKRSVLALGLLNFLAPRKGELREVVEGMDAVETLKGNDSLQKVLSKDLLNDSIKVLS